MQLTVHDIARMTDLSSVRANVDLAEINELAAQAKRFDCIIAYALPCYLAELKKLLADAPSVGLGGTVGFPSGATTTEMKTFEAKHLIEIGAAELDMVVNIGMLLSGQDDYVRDDIKAVVDAAGDVEVKVILECHYLSDDQIKRGSELCVEAGAAWVKTGSGWPETGATIENIALIKSVVGDDALVKASGGVRDLPTLAEMYRRGARRFGIGLKAGVALLEECEALPGGALEV